MPMIEFTAGEGGNFELLPKGTYNFRITKAEVKPVKSGDHNTMHVKTTVIDGPYEEKKATLFCTLKPGKSWVLRMLLEACLPGKYETFETGEKDDEGKPITGFRFDSDDLVDSTFTADIEHRKDDKGQDQQDFRKIRELKADASTVDEEAAQRAEGAGSTEAKPAEGGEQRSLRRRVAS